LKILRELVRRNRAGSGEALASVCSAHPDVISASLLLAKAHDTGLLVEATSNQVNQFGGYTGMTPATFVRFVHELADRQGVERERVAFGGDHLGPQAWRDQPAPVAMALAVEMVQDYARAGYEKIHLDCSEGCVGESAQVGDMLSAERAAELAQACETAAPDGRLSYVFGTEVPPPGGARAAEVGAAISPTTPTAARATIAAHEAAFLHRKLGDAWERAVGLVVQPGLEFGPDHIDRFSLDSPNLLSDVLSVRPCLAFEAHSTDYQTPQTFPALAKRHFAVLKVGPALTFAYREALYALDGIAAWVVSGAAPQTLPRIMDKLMLAEPAFWAKHYQGDPARLRILRHFSYADRIRYYWSGPEAAAATARLRASLETAPLPSPLLSQYFGEATLVRADALRGRCGQVEALIYARIQDALEPYFACAPASRPQ
jgi:D-tagatose-1,6-bisphosphate aldolase subunit GatZ/KbaZ